MVTEKLKSFARRIKKELLVYKAVLADRRTPLPAKIFLGAGVVYLCMPFDLITDFIPILGALDDELAALASTDDCDHFKVCRISPEVEARHGVEVVG